MLSLGSHFTQNKVFTRNPRHNLSIHIKGRGTWKILYCFFIPVFSLGNAKTKNKFSKCIEVVK